MFFCAALSRSFTVRSLRMRLKPKPSGRDGPVLVVRDETTKVRSNLKDDPRCILFPYQTREPRPPLVQNSTAIILHCCCIAKF